MIKLFTRIEVTTKNIYSTKRSFFLNKPLRQAQKNEEFKPIFHFPYIRAISLINRLKMYQTLATLVGIPASVILNHMNYIGQEKVMLTASVGLSGCITLYGMGYIANKFIGFIYCNEENNILKIAYCDFWGNRKDVLVSIKDIEPLMDAPSRLTDNLYLTVKRYSTKETFKLSKTFGIILDKEKFNKVL